MESQLQLLRSRDPEAHFGYLPSYQRPAPQIPGASPPTLPAGLALPPPRQNHNEGTSSGTSTSQSQLQYFHQKQIDFGKSDDSRELGAENPETFGSIRRSDLRRPVMAPPQPVVSFEILDHEILKKQDFVVYYLIVNTKSTTWTVQQRYSYFKEFHDQMLKKNSIQKQFLPSLPPKRLLRKSRDVIEERKRLLADYLNRLSLNFNVFRDELVMQFLNQDSEQPQMRHLASLQDQFLSRFEAYSLGLAASKTALNTITSSEQISKSSSSLSNSRKLSLGEKKSAKKGRGKGMSEVSEIERELGADRILLAPQLQRLQGQKQKKGEKPKMIVSTRLRGFSDEYKQENGPFSPLILPAAQWAQRKFEGLDDRINSWLQELQTNTENQSQLIQDLQEYYFGEKPIVPVDLLKRLFFGYLKNQGLLDHLKDCHRDQKSLKTRALLGFIVKLLDINKCHQIEEISQIWKTLKPDFIKECHFEQMMDAQQSVKEAALTLIKIYLDGKLFKIIDLIKDEKFAQKFHVWQTSKNRQQKSFTSTSSLGANSQSNMNHNTRSLQIKRSQIRPQFGSSQHLSEQLRTRTVNDSARKQTENPISNEPQNPNQSSLKSPDYPENRLSSSGGSLHSSDSDSPDYLFERKTQIERQKNKRQSVQVVVPREIVYDRNIQIQVSPSGGEVSSKDIVSCRQNSTKIDGFDLGTEIKELIKRYNRRFNLIYHTYQIEDIEPHKVAGQINQYVFEQSKSNTSLKLKLSYLENLIEGVSKGTQQEKGSWMQQKMASLSPCIRHFFSDLQGEIIKTIDKNNKIVRFSFKRKISLNFQDFLQESTKVPPVLSNECKNRQHFEEKGTEIEYVMLVSSQVAAGASGDDQATMSFFEFDLESNSIVPQNFIIVSQSIKKSGLDAQKSGINDLKQRQFKSFQESKTQSYAKYKQFDAKTTGKADCLQNLSFADQKKPQIFKSNALEMYRTLSAVSEETEGQNLYPKAPKTANASQISQKTKPQNSSRIDQKRLDLDDQGQENNKCGLEDEQDMLFLDGDLARTALLQESDQESDDLNGMLEPLSNKNARHALLNPENQDEINHNQPARKLPSTATTSSGIQSAKVSLSTAKSSNTAASAKFLGSGNICNKQQVNDSESQEYTQGTSAHPFPPTHGPLSLTMRTSPRHSTTLLHKLLALFKGLATEINMELHGVRA